MNTDETPPMRSTRLREVSVTTGTYTFNRTELVFHADNAHTVGLLLQPGDALKTVVIQLRAAATALEKCIDK